jgi:hypothetical protein
MGRDILIPAVSKLEVIMRNKQMNIQRNYVTHNHYFMIKLTKIIEALHQEEVFRDAREHVLGQQPTNLRRFALFALAYQPPASSVFLSEQTSH